MRDHPRVCGEKFCVASDWQCVQGSPPRMRGKERGFDDGQALLGITPAYAGKSVGQVELQLGVRDHPRVCGEKCQPGPRFPGWAGSPPRMRGKAPAQTLTGSASRITPACAGKRSKTTSTFSLLRDHPRVCGEKRVFATSFAEIPGSPPRVRGKVIRCEELARVVGITPACAGKSRPGRGAGTPYRDHPRVCGEKKVSRDGVAYKWGSPPRMRGKEHLVEGQAIFSGITPAYAGKRKRVVHG